MNLRNPVQMHPRVVQRSWGHTSGGYAFTPPVNPTVVFGANFVNNAIAPIPHGYIGQNLNSTSSSGVEEGDVGSYAVVQFLEKVGDQLTGDHQPSGAAVKENLRIALHNLKQGPLTRSMARNAYKKAITVVVQDSWHKAESRTYGGRNTKQQIAQDAVNLFDAAVADFKLLADKLHKDKWTQTEIQQLWDDLQQARNAFYTHGTVQLGTFN